ncbi:MAG TPA: exodeoxyribonuclease VII small subunit [Acidimicrobiia bacterium]|nr:exodeoxyribonuclease VII small subunit [Acidimicrobiia bacterium]
MSTPSGDTDDATTGDLGYAEAMTELEDILDELEGDHLDVDVLAERVRRAAELIKLCRSRIARAQNDVNRIVTDLEVFESETGGAAEAGNNEDELEGDVAAHEADELF